MSRPAAADRVARMLSIVPWVATRGSASVQEVCSRFDIDPDQLLRDLTVVSMVGLYPYTPDVLVELFVDHDEVCITLPQAFVKPLSLTPEQGLALVAAGATLASVPGADPHGPLARGLEKLASVLEHGGRPALEVRLEDVSTTVLGVLQEGVKEHRQVRLDYYAYGRDEMTSRVVDPHRVTTDQGRWYLSAFCHLAGDERLFRIDRVQAAGLLNSTFEVPDGVLDTGWFRPAPDDPRVTIEMESEARWAIEHLPVDEIVDHDGGRLRVRLAVTAKQWLERLVLGLGPTARVVEGPQDLRVAGEESARRILQRYRRHGHPPGAGGPGEPGA